MIQFKTTRTGVTLYSWGGNNLTNHSAIYHYIHSSLWGGNLGHSALLLTILNTPENLQFVKDKLGEEYNPSTDSSCIPWMQKTYVTPSIDLSKFDSQPDYDNPAFEENVIEIYFSWCNVDNEKGFGFQTYTHDLIDGRCDVAGDYKDIWKSYLHPEERSRTGRLHSYSNCNESILLNSYQVIHTSGTTIEEKLYLLSYQEGVDILRNIEAIELLHNKIEDRDEKHIASPISNTEARLIAKYFPEVDLNQSIDLAMMLEKISMKRIKLHNDYNINYLHTLHASINLSITKSKGKYCLTELERDYFDTICRLGTLYKKLREVKLDNANDEVINDCIGYISRFMRNRRNAKIFKHYHSFYEGQDFPNNLNAKSLSLFIDDVSFDINPDKEGLRVTGGNIYKDLMRERNGIEKKHIVIMGYVEKYNALYVELEIKLKNFANLKSLLETALSDIQGKSYNSSILLENEELLKKFSLPFSHYILLKCYRPDSLNTTSGLQGVLDELLKESEGIYSQITSFVNNPVFDVDDFVQKYTVPLLERAVSIGLEPAMVRLPFCNELEVNNVHQSGLKYKEMITRMAELAVNGNPFNIVDNNCSVSASRVLAAGAQDDQNRQEIFNEAELFGSLTAPLTLFNNAIQYSKSLKNSNHIPLYHNYIKTAERYAAQTAISQIAKAYDDEAPISKIVLHYTLGILSAGVCSAIALPRYLWNISAPKSFKC